MKCVWWQSLSSRKKKQVKIMQNRKYMESREMDSLEDTKMTTEQWPKGSEGDHKLCEQLRGEWGQSERDRDANILLPP